MNGLKKNLNKGLQLVFICLVPLVLSAQELPPVKELNILFYNTENFFDTADDPLILDEEFLPGGSRYWSKRRFEKKRNDIAKVILASCEYNTPAIIGLAEVENRYVLEALTSDGPLAPNHYRIIHKDSPDERGIDVALLYRRDIVRPLRYAYFPLKDEHDQLILTREILYASFVVPSGDTLHVFFNHWPSRYSGQLETEPQRMIAAMTLRQHIDSLLQTGRSPCIVIMGDFNDQPQNKSLTEGLGVKDKNDPGKKGEIINLSAAWTQKGTLKFRQSWQIFDQVMVSDFLLDRDHLHSRPDWATIVSNAFLLESDPNFKGKRPYRTYQGYRYYGGISDHLPVRLKLELPGQPVSYRD
ncbi:MAG: endonuclease [Mangrovibacterium sp.]